jgi:hypothetical protein
MKNSGSMLISYFICRDFVQSTNELYIVICVCVVLSMIEDPSCLYCARTVPVILCTAISYPKSMVFGIKVVFSFSPKLFSFCKGFD